MGYSNIEHKQVELNVKMTWGGIGPKLAFISLPYVILSLIVIYKDPEFLRLDFLNSFYVQLIGYFIFVIGFVFWVAAAVVFVTDFKKCNLVVRGPFALCRNPIYASWIVFIIPAMVLIYQSGMILTIGLVLYLNFKLSIHGERIILQRNYGEAYDIYEKSVNELFPFPKVRKNVQ